MKNKRTVAFLTTYCDFFWDFEQENIKQVKSMGYDVVLIANCKVPERSNHKKNLEELGVDIIHIPFKRSPLNLITISNYIKLKYVISNVAPIAIDCHLAVVGALSRLVCRKKKNVKIIYSPHGFFFYKGCPRINRLLYENIEKLLARYTDALIVINREDYASASNMKVRGTTYFLSGVGVDIEKIQGITLDNNYIKAELKIPDNSFVFLSVGELNINKNHILVLQAMEKLQTEGLDNFHYIICGRGEQKENLLLYVRLHKLEGRVHLLGYRHDIIKINKQADAFILPSFKEGLSVSIIEAMACGLPILASNIRGNIDLVDDRKSGYLFPPNDVAELSEKLKAMLLNKELCYKMGKYNIIKSTQYSKSNVRKQMEKIYSEVLM